MHSLGTICNVVLKEVGIHLQQYMDFLNLPPEIRENVYDNMHIEDRIKLNSVLATGNEPTITQTLNTDSVKDKHLALVSYLFKKKPNAKLRSRLQAFMKHNSTDPTVKDILELRKENKDLSDHEKRMENLLMDVSLKQFDKNVNYAQRYPRLDDLTMDDSKRIFTAIMDQSSVEFLKHFPVLNILRHVFEEGTYNPLSECVFSEREDLFKELVRHADRYELEFSVEYFKSIENLKTIAYRPETLQIVMRHLNVLEMTKEHQTTLMYRLNGNTSICPIHSCSLPSVDVPSILIRIYQVSWSW